MYKRSFKKYIRNVCDLLVLTTSSPLTSDFQEHVENMLHFVKHNRFLDAHRFSDFGEIHCIIAVSHFRAIR